MLEISSDGNPGIGVELESSSRRLGERYYIGGHKDFGYIVVSQLASPWSLTRTEFLIRCAYCDTRNNLTFHSTSHRSPWITGKLGRNRTAPRRLKNNKHIIRSEPGFAPTWVAIGFNCPSQRMFLD